MDEQELETMLKPYGQVVSTRILRDANAPTEPLLCKFADGGQKKRQSQNKYVPNGRSWAREGEARLAGMTLTYDPTAAAMQNGFYPPYSITNRMIAQPAMSPYISPVSTYPACINPVQTPSWVTHQPYIMQHPFMPANAALQGAYIPQYTPMPPAAVEENSSQPQVESSGDHSPYAYQQTK
ncbi:RNA-binding motif, single-stranded-interacting protein 1 [Bagarius yarrelli]|uniref:RNA-binding motif, single-stranded-interacting protein 1 n=1 Tax=Bagarius yarrelli TaxID=175774 RepID=A0A556U4M1_BAGYA|nr:RNA-binding motif, single-stranded-interacting protein 1 [Bagarius yarrelli]